jgi:hypothetical protein
LGGRGLIIRKKDKQKMKYYKVKKDIELITMKEVSNGFVKGQYAVELIKNELLTEKELKRLYIDNYKDNGDIFDVIVTSSHNTYISFGVRKLTISDEAIKRHKEMMKLKKLVKKLLNDGVDYSDIEEIVFNLTNKAHR